MENFILSGFSDEVCEEFDGQLAAMKEFGLSHIELRGADGVNVSDFTEEKLEEIQKKLCAAGITVSSIGSPIGKTGIDDDFTSHLEKLRRTIDIAKKLETPCIRIFSFYYPKEDGPEKYRDQVFFRMEKMAELARRENMILLHENEKGIYGDTAPRCLRLMERFSGPNFQAVFDFANFVECGQDTLEAYELLKPYIKYVHVKDALKEGKEIVPAGKGDGHVAEILRDLAQSGYRGFLSLEPHLVDFSGLDSLEQDPKKRECQLDGKSAWKLALSSLQELLKTIG